MKRGAVVRNIIAVAAIFTCIGWVAMAAPASAGSEGPNNTVYGDNSGIAITGNHNATFGVNAGQYINSGNYNTSIGVDAGGWAGSGYNTFVGAAAGFLAVGGYNTYVGYNTGWGSANWPQFLLNTGFRNTFVGNNSGYNNGAGQDNTFLGYSSGMGNITGNYNTFVGFEAGHNNSTGGLNVFLGYQAGYNETGSNKLYISNSSTPFPLIHGDFTLAELKVYGTMIVDTVAGVSDERFKKDIHPLSASLDKIMKLQGVSYQWKESESGRGFRKGEQIGLLAQDVERILPELVITDNRGYKAVAYDKLVPVLIEAVKEQQKEIRANELSYETSLKDKDGRIEKLEKALELLEKRLASLEQPIRTVASK